MATKSSSPARSAGQIESDLDSVRSRLTLSIETLIDQVHPTRIKQRETAKLKQQVAAKVDQLKTEALRARDRLKTEALYARDVAKTEAIQARDRVKSEVFEADGQLRTKRVAVAGGVVAGVTTVWLVVRALVARGRK